MRLQISSTRLIARLTFALVFLLPATGHAQSPEADAPLQALRARAIGPAGMSGRITAIAALESDPNVVYVGAASGGVWKSLNGGDTWTPLFDDQRIANIGAIAVHQASRDVVWVGTGEGNPRNSADPGAGIWRSLDGGASWSFLGLEETRQIHRIHLHPTDPDVAWVGAMGPIWSAGSERGVFHTTDGGKTWRKVLYVDEDTGVSEFVQDPVNPNKMFAAMWTFRRQPWFFESGGEGSGLHLTFDGGESWERLGAEHGLPAGRLGRMGLAIARSNPDVVYALIEAEQGGGLYRSLDGGRSFDLVNGDRNVLNRPFYYAEIYVDPENELRVYNLSSRVTVSTDGGRTFQAMPGDVHPDFHAMWINPADGRHIYLGNDGGLVISHDRAQNWRIVDNLPVGQFYHISVDMDVPFNVYGGMQDNGSWKGPSDVWAVDGIRNYEWRETSFGDGFNSMVDPRTPSVGYGMSQGGNLVRWDTRTGERKPIRPYHEDADVELRFNWNAALALDPFAPGRIYYGSQFVHVSSDQGETWETISPDLTTDDPEKQKADESGGITRDATGAENHTTIITIAPSSVEQGVIWVGTDDGNVQLTRDQGASWSDLTAGLQGVAPGTWVPHIEASQHDAATAYVVKDDHRRGGWEPWIFKTTDYGRTWQNIAEGIDGYVHTLEEDPVVPELLWAGSELGLWYSLDQGGSWQRFDSGIPTVPVRSIVTHPRDHDLAIGTFGRSIYIIDDIRPLRELAANEGRVTAAVHLFEPPHGWLRRTRAVDGYHFSGETLFKGEARPEGIPLTYAVTDSMTNGGARVEVIGSGDAVLRVLTGPSSVGIHRVVWDLRETLPSADSEERGSRFGPAGPEVLPGEYRVRVTVGDHVSEVRPLTVLPDPRIEVPMADRRARRAAIDRGLALAARLAQLEARHRELEQALDDFVEVLDAQGAEVGAALEEGVAAVRAALEQEVDLGQAGRYRRGVFALQSTWGAPGRGELLGLERFDAAVARAVSAFNGVIDGAFAELERLASAADLQLLAKVQPLEAVDSR